LSALHGKIEQCVCNKFCIKLCTTESIEMLHEAFGEQRLLNGIHISRVVKFQLKMTNARDDQATENVEKI
jgi:hypothetical protein